MLLPGVPSEAVQVPHSVVVSDDPVNWTPNIRDGQVNAILQIGTKVVVGGTFTTVRRANTQADLTRNYIFAFDMGTGAIDPSFVPQLTGAVNALEAGPDGQSIFVGGTFNAVNGNTSYRRLVRLSLANGQIVTGFQANASSAVQDLVLRGGWLYVSGQFTSIRNTPRAALARVDPTTGAVDANLDLPFASPQLGGSLSARKIDVTPDGTKLVAIGNFSQVAGLPRDQMAVIDLSTTPASVSSWQTSMTPFVNPANPTQTWCSGSFQTWMRDIDISPDGSYWVLVTTGAYRANRLCDSASRWETSATGPNQVPTWINWTGGDTLWSVGVTGTAIYTGGHERWVNNPYRGDAAGPGAIAREGIEALDPVNGLPFTWNPGRTRGVGVFSMPASADGLWVGSDTDQLGGEFHQKIGFFPVAGGLSVPPNVPYALPADLYNMDLATGNLLRRSFNGTAFGSASVVPTGVDWRQARGAFALNGRVYTGWSNGTLTVRTFDGATMSQPSTIDLNGLQTAPPTTFLIPGTTTPIPSFATHLANMTGLFFDNGRVYYTVTGNPRLYYRYFTPQSQTVGANLFVGSTGDGVDWSNVRGMTLANGNLYFALANNNLYRVAWTGGRPVGPVTQIAGPSINGTSWASNGIFAFAGATSDTQPPTAPGKPSGVSTTTDSIDITWQASTDNVPGPLTYRVYRDGNPTPVAQVSSSSTTTVGYHDGGLVAGSTHVYRVDAVDAAGNPSPMGPASDPITVLTGGGGGPIFSDDFSSGSFAGWTSVTRLTIDAGQGSPGPPSARGAPVAQSAFAYRNLGATHASACLSVMVNAASLGGTGVDLFRLRNAAGGPISKVFVHATGTLSVRSDFGASQINSGVALGTGWHEVELCGAVGTAGAWDLYRDGVKIVDAWIANTGPEPIGRVQIGDTAAKSWTINFDDVILDQAPG